MGGRFETVVLALVGTLAAGFLLWAFLPADDAGSPGRWLFEPRPMPPVLFLVVMIALLVIVVLLVRRRQD